MRKSTVLCFPLQLLYPVRSHLCQLFGYLLIFALAAEKVEEVDDNSGCHQDLQVVVLPVCSLKGHTRLRSFYVFMTRQGVVLNDADSY